MKSPENLNYLFQRFLEGKSTREELHQLFDHFNVTDQQQLNTLIQETLEDESDPDIDRREKMQQLYQGISHRIDAPERKGLIKILRIAAAIAAMLIIAIGYYVWSNRPVEIKTVFAALGQRIEITLPDSSKIWLNAGSTLQYPVKFNSEKRVVTLKNGDVYFEVVHNSHQPFVVHTNRTDVNVLGTSFEISAFEKDKTTNVTVATGKVGVLENKEITFLLPGERAIIDHVTHHLKKVKVDPADVAAWRTGRLLFDNQPLPEVMQSLERAYNVIIKITNNKLLDERVTMRLNNQPLTDVLTAISFSNHFTFKRINEHLVIVN